VLSTPSREEIEHRFQQLCAEVGRRGIVGFSPVSAVRLLPAQAQYLQYKLRTLEPTEDVTAVSLGLFYYEHEVLAVPSTWRNKPSPDDRWNDYARAYQTLNRLLNHFVATLATEFGGLLSKSLSKAVRRSSNMSLATFRIAFRTAPSPRQQGWFGAAGTV